MGDIIEYTVKEYAARERVTERTVYNWMAKRAVMFRHTPGGGVRIMEPRNSGVVFFGLQSSESSRNPSA